MDFFEAVTIICLVGQPEMCRDALVPGYAAPTLSACRAALAERPPKTNETTVCAPKGPSLDLEEIAPGVFVHFGAIAEPDATNGGDVANLGVVIGERSVAVIDVGSSAALAEALWRAIRQRTDLPVSHVILTHMHPDHVLGAAPFAAAGAEIVGHARLERALAERYGNFAESMAAALGPIAFLGSDIVSVDVAVNDSATLDLGGRVLAVEAWPNAHTGTDVTVTLPASGILFAGDLVFADHLPALDGSLGGWQAVLGRLRARDLTTIVPGHGRTTLDWPEGADPVVRYLDTLARDTRAALAAGLSLSEAVPRIAAGEAAEWQLFDAYNPRNATVAYTELEWE